jgi:dTDP-4-dehydrorhamnose reductase
MGPLSGPVLLLSPDGMLGRAWLELLRNRDIPFAEADRFVVDLTNRETVERILDPKYRWVINCSAWTDVDGAETNEALATAINGTGVGWLVDRCRRIGASLLHYSTDYVFRGRASRPYATTDPHDPTNAYGRSKAVGERYVIESDLSHITVRTSWLYAPWAKNFVRTIARLGQERSSVRVVDDQRGTPTSAEHLARTSLALMERDCASRGLDGVFHVTDGGECSWFEFARAILDATKSPCRVEPCTTDEFPRPARRPAYSVLDVSKATRQVGPFPSWQVNLAGVIAALEPV